MLPLTGKESPHICRSEADDQGDRPTNGGAKLAQLRSGESISKNTTAPEQAHSNREGIE